MTSFGYWIVTNYNWIHFGIAMILLLVSFFLLAKKLLRNKWNVVDALSLGMFSCIWLGSFMVILASQPEAGAETAPKVIESLYSALKLFFGDGKSNFNTQNAIGIHYQALYYVFAFWAPLSLVVTALSYFDNFFSILKIKFLYRRKNVIVFNELSEKNLAIAQNFKNAPQKMYGAYDKNSPNAFFDVDYFYALEKKQEIFIFCDVYKDNTEKAHELIEQANECGYFLLKDDVVTLHKKIRRSLLRNIKKKLIRYFLSGVDENENIRHAVEIAAMEGKKPIKNFAIFTFAEGEANGHIIEALNTSAEFFVKRISPSHLMAIDILTKPENRLISSAKQEDIEKNLKVLILGLGSYGFEIGKFLSWYYQRLTGNIKIYFVDSATNMLSYLKGSYSDFINYRPNLAAPDQNACFEFSFYEGVDVFGDDFTKVLKEIYEEEGPGLEKGLDAVFCVLGDDNKNIEAAFHLRKLLDRINYDSLSKINFDLIVNFDEKKSECEEAQSKVGADFSCCAYDYKNGVLIDKIRIFSIVHNDKIKKNFADSTGFIKGCNIEFVGEDSSTYGYENIFDVALEQKAVTRGRTPDTGEKMIRKNIIKHNSKEYFRNSSLSEHLYEEFIETLYPPKDDDIQYDELRCKIGNKRWNAYMLSIGRTCFAVDRKYAKTIFAQRKKIKTLPISQWERGMWHNSIIPYAELPPKEQENNYRKPK